MAWSFQELNVRGLHQAIIPQEIIGLEKQKDAAAALLADLLDLFGCIRLRKEQTRAAGAGGSNNEPAFAAGFAIIPQRQARRQKQNGGSSSGERANNPHHPFISG